MSKLKYMVMLAGVGVLVSIGLSMRAQEVTTRTEIYDLNYFCDADLPIDSYEQANNWLFYLEALFGGVIPAPEYETCGKPSNKIIISFLQRNEAREAVEPYLTAMFLRASQANTREIATANLVEAYSYTLLMCGKNYGCFEHFVRKGVEDTEIDLDLFNCPGHSNEHLVRGYYYSTALEQANICSVSDVSNSHLTGTFNAFTDVIWDQIGD